MANQDGYMLDRQSIDTLNTVITRSLGPQQLRAAGGIGVGNTFQLKHVRLTAVETPTPSESADMIGYTAEVLKVDYATKQLVGTGLTFDPDGNPEDDSIVKNYVYEVNKNADLVGKVFTVNYKPVSDDSVNGIWIFSGSAGSGGGTEYIQVTNVDYTANNGIGGSPTYIYRAVLIDDIEEPLIASPSEDDKVNIKVVDGYPWNLKVGDNLVKIGENSSGTVYYINNTIAPDPVIKIVAGSPEVYDMEDGGASLTAVKPDYLIMSDPSLLTLSAYDDLFLIAQWSKREQLVRINIPVI